tara:strand:- start:38938 stop:39831 length:894 start_codon:yes stop_codon:yes gene_type:complete
MQIYNIETNANGKELTSHGDDDFPCAFYDEKFSQFITGEVPWHWHDEIELVYVVEGSCQVESLTDSLILEQGDAVFINATCLHKLVDIGEVDCHILNFVLNPVVIGGANYSRAYKKYVFPVIKNTQFLIYKFSAGDAWHQQVIDELIKAFVCCQLAGERDELALQIHLMSFWNIFYQHQLKLLVETPLTSNYQRRVQKLLSFIHAHYYEDLSVLAMSDAANISESECYRLFKKALKTTPNQYLTEYRLQKAANLLIESDKQVTQIAHQVGFNCAAYFSKRFRLAFGQTPKQFRHQAF